MQSRPRREKGRRGGVHLVRRTSRLIDSFLQKQKEDFLSSVYSRWNQSYRIGAEDYQMVAVLGAGAEGTVYLLESRSGQRLTLKSFESESMMQINIENLHALKNTGTPTIDIMGTINSRSFVADYVAGMSLQQIRKSHLDVYDKTFFENEFRRLRGRYPDINRLNWLLYFDKDSVSAKVIDPH